MIDEWELRELIASWTLDEDDWKLLANKTGATRLGFGLLLKFFDLEGRFPVLRRARGCARRGPGPARSGQPGRLR